MFLSLKLLRTLTKYNIRVIIKENLNVENKTKYIPFEKMSKKAQKEYNKRQRNTWGELKPVTRIVPNKKAYNRRAFAQ